MRVFTQSVHLSAPILQPGVLRAALVEVVKETTFDIEREVKRRMQEPKSGRTYARGAITKRASKVTRGLGLRERTTAKGNKRAIAGYNFHRASAPGEAPAVDTSVLINSVRGKPDGLRGEVSSGAAQAAQLEYQMNRPAFEPALDTAIPSFIARVDETVREMCR